MAYDKIDFDDGKGRPRHGSISFYKMLEEMADIHDRKSYDYTSADNPAGNYHFAGMLSQLFHDPRDAGFIGRIGEKLYRLANLENHGKVALNESIEDTERDISVIMVLWMSDRRDRRQSKMNKIPEYSPTGGLSPQIDKSYKEAVSRGDSQIEVQAQTTQKQRRD